ncbi:diaminopimelate epimerase [Nitrosomonas marina]|uniref:Diaminopimelate epimerase n=1 Tax=Nitrosomonas marina TaxID=917 RepID=A0A1I0CJP6_9PROT|nr:diaminopimelate epimerase [Nitrosomonas marina]SET19395.1 diaminopimelate epimerase [Nitrosomonas marina]
MRIKAIKMDGCGNSFLVVDEMKTPLAEMDKVHLSKAMAIQHDTDGILYVNFLQGMPTMRIFDRDGTEETMCGNGLRCATRYFRDNYIPNDCFTIMTGDGIKHVRTNNHTVEVNLGKVREYQQINEQLHFVFTGVPHVVVIGYCIDIDTARNLGRSLRTEKSLCEFVGHPEGVNVNFIWLEEDSISIRTYEVGVENITQSCGTGSAASAFVASRVFETAFPINTRSLGGNLEITYDDEYLSISGLTRYQGRITGFINTPFTKPVSPAYYWPREYAWDSL